MKKLLWVVAALIFVLILTGRLFGQTVNPFDETGTNKCKVEKCEGKPGTDCDSPSPENGSMRLPVPHEGQGVSMCL